MRGQRQGACPRDGPARIIPARAGPTVLPNFCALSDADHPRSCGANCIGFPFIILWCGSSPLVRGQRVQAILTTDKFRIIPARAGPTDPDSGHARGPADHPRSCGANKFDWRDISPVIGSSPLVRGQLKDDDDARLRIRIIPARAGPTSVWNRTSIHGADHPRSCGANSVNMQMVKAVSGSSPLVRGQPMQKMPPLPRFRIIPARAGPTGPEGSQEPPPPDHPRSCGANSGPVIVSLHQRGSSPLVRGQPDPYKRLRIP